jgi:hypothetical protein
MEFDEPWKKIFNLKCLWLVLARFDCIGNALPSSLIDSNVSLRWKQQKSKELGHDPWLVTLLGWGVEGCAGALGWGLGRVTSINYSHGLAQTKQQVG